MARKKLLHLKSGVVNNGTPKLPTSEQIELGEIAVNYAEGYETLAIKNSNGDVVPFTNSITMMDYIDSAVSGMDEVSIVYSGETGPDSGSTIEIIIDENVDQTEVDVYTQSQVNDLISAATEDAKGIIKVAESGETEQELGEILIDENLVPFEEEFYTKSQVDTMIQAIYNAIDKLKADNHLI